MFLAMQVQKLEASPRGPQGSDPGSDMRRDSAHAAKSSSRKRGRQDDIMILRALLNVARTEPTQESASSRGHWVHKVFGTGLQKI